MNSSKVIALVFVLGSLLTLAIPTAKASVIDKDTFLTFSGPVEVPGMVIGPGRYEFRMLGLLGNDVEICDASGRVLEVVPTLPVSRSTITDNTVVTLEHRGPGSPEAIKSWFYPDMHTGVQFEYPKAAQPVGGR